MFRYFYIEMQFYVVLLAVAVGHVSCQDDGCDYFQVIEPNTSVTVISPGYPNSYPQGATCRWIASCPNGRCVLDCTEISLPQSSDCSVDKLLVSKSGDPYLVGADTFCGSGTTNIVSNGDQLSIGLITSPNSPGGRFSCELSSTSPATPTCSCGYKKMNRIVGGVETGVNEYPMMAGLVDLSSRQIYCGAVIIDKLYLLTAAHCLTNDNIGNIAIVVGEHDVNVGDSPATQVYEIDDTQIHDGYNEDTNDYDIAIIKTKNNMEFSDRVGPVCLPFKYQSKSIVGSRVTALGWGLEFFGGTKSNTLQKVDLDVISDAQCQREVSARQICTYTPDKDSCQMDSGGPLLYTDPSTGLLFNVGIISYGESCAITPAINTRVTKLLSWITQNTPGADYCRK